MIRCSGVQKKVKGHAIHVYGTAPQAQGLEKQRTRGMIDCGIFKGLDDLELRQQKGAEWRWVSSGREQAPDCS